MFINYCSSISLQESHGKAIPLDIRDHHAPFPSLFIFHEMLVRGLNLFQTIPNMPDDLVWQDWVLTDGIFDSVSGGFHRNGPPASLNNRVSEQKLQLQQSQGATSGGDTSSKSGTYKLELNDEVIAEILAASRTLPSWKACQIEGTSWTGTAEENTDKYLSIVQPP